MSLSHVHLHIIRLHVESALDQGRYSVVSETVPSVEDIIDSWGEQHSKRLSSLAHDTCFLLKYTDISTPRQFDSVTNTILNIAKHYDSDVTKEAIDSLVYISGSFTSFMRIISPLLSQMFRNIDTASDNEKIKLAQLIIFILAKCTQKHELLHLIAVNFKSNTIDYIWDMEITPDEVFGTFRTQPSKIGSLPLFVATLLQSRNEKVRSFAYHVIAAKSAVFPDIASRMIGILKKGIWFESENNRVLVCFLLSDICCRHKIAADFALSLVGYPCEKVAAISVFTIGRLLLEDVWGLEVERQIAVMAKFLVTYDMGRNQKLKNSKEIDAGVKFVKHCFQLYSSNHSQHQQELINTVVWVTLNAIVEKRIVIDDRITVATNVHPILRIIMESIGSEYLETILFGLRENLKEGLGMELSDVQLYNILGIQEKLND
ncbi:hypothetical protein P9112_005521 [Eukaryota sp. TZLM1-RC]